MESEDKKYTLPELKKKLTEKEIWMDIKGYEGLYQISNLGRLKSLDRMVTHSTVNKITIKERLKKLCVNTYGYPISTLYKNGICKTHLIHILVANAFIQKETELLQVNHKKGIKTDNRAKELEWCTAQQNTDHAIKTGLRSQYDGSNNPNVKINQEQALKIKMLYSTGNYKLVDLAKMFNISKSLVSLIKREEIWMKNTA